MDKKICLSGEISPNLATLSSEWNSFALKRKFVRSLRDRLFRKLIFASTGNFLNFGNLKVSFKSLAASIRSRLISSLGN